MTVVKMPDGTDVDFGDLPSDRIKALIASKFPKEAQAKASAPRSAIGTLASEAANAITMGIADRADALGDAMFGRPADGGSLDVGQTYDQGGLWDRYDKVLEYNQDRRTQSREDHPVAAIGGAVAGSFVPGAGLAKAAQAIGVPLAKTAGARVLAATGGGAAMGATIGFNEAKPGERLKDAGIGGLVGGAGGGAVGGAAELAARVAAPVAGMISRRGASGAARKVGVSEDAAKVARSVLANDNPKDVLARLQRGGPDAMLADAGYAPAAMLDASLQQPGPAQQLARDAVDGRAAKAGRELKGALDDTLGAPRGLKEITREVAQDTAPARAKAFDKAYATPIDYSSPQGRRVEATLKFVPPRYMRRAIAKAAEDAQINGIDPRQILAMVGDDGTITKGELPNIMQLDHLKRGLDDVVRDETDRLTGKISSDGWRAMKLSGMVREALSEASPEYAAAARLGGEKIERQLAAEFGSKLFNAKTTREDTALMIKRFGPEQMESLKQGVRYGIGEVMANTRTALTDPNMDAREALSALRQMNTPAGREKLALITKGSKEGPALRRQIARTLAALELRATISTNSKTAARLAAKEGVDEITAPGVVGEVLRGKPLDAGRRAIQEATNTTAQDDAARKAAIYADLARLMTEPRGAEATRVYRALTNFAERDLISQQQASKVRKLLLQGGVTASPASGAAATQMAQ